MDKPNLAEIKKELKTISTTKLLDICLRLAKYKTENKELLSYLLFYNDNLDDYVKDVKVLIDSFFSEIPTSPYYAIKSIRKLLRILNKHIKYIGNKPAEADLLIYYCKLFIQSSHIKTSHKSLILLIFRPLKRITKLIIKLDDDFKFDFEREFDELIALLEIRRPGFSLLEIN